ncbi:putative unusual protein kinase [Synechococcus sp. PCC 7502]|uniref:ABC1 kinase family protein n=1 Tax=Synechococcus sp. PCC 7502 TaxID=1173263 RepID=UPI00029FE55E|nr:AarF/ABC1/UbiB kinase family protein [Synechococcus sp. PCC 7502]AFY72456.1 putative unusual protein kinase [Synechococcus sp. PCC 7502]
MNYLDQCHDYDYQAIAYHYNRRPWLAIWRILSVIFMFLGFIWGLGWDKITNQELKNQTKRAQHLRRIITKLGPTFIKIGQALSTRPDLVRADFLAELVKLQDQLPAFPTPHAFRTIERELGLPLNQVYAYISPTPVAAASLGQVYKANLLTGEEVAIKVQRPNLIPTITLDLYVIRKLVTWIAPFLPLNLGQNLDTVVDEFGLKLFEEIDYINEATNAERFATYFAGDRQVKVPVIYRRFSTRYVLTMEWINGIKLTDTAAIKAAGLDTDELVKIGVLSGMRQLLEFGFFHADPHPGNLFATYDGRMAYIDFGMMDQLDLNTKEQLVDSVVHLINKDYQQLGQDYVNLGFLAPNVEMMPIVAALEAVLGDIMTEKVSEFNFKVVTDRFSDLMYTYPFCLPAKFALIIRSVITQEGVALSMNPEFKIVQVAYPYVARRLLTDESASLRRRLLEVLFKDNKFQWARLENLIAIAKSDQNFDLVPTATLGLQYLFSEEGKLLRQRLIMALTEDDRLHITEIQRLWQLIAADLEPTKLWNAAMGRFNFSLPPIPQAIAAMIPVALIPSFSPPINP